MKITDSNTPLHLIKAKYPVPYQIPQKKNIIKKLYDKGNQTFELKDLYYEAMRLYYLSYKDRNLPEVKIHKYLTNNNNYKAFSLLLELYEAQKVYKERQPEIGRAPV